MHLFRMTYVHHNGEVHECEVIAENLEVAMELASSEGIAKMISLKRTPYIDPLEGKDWGYLH